jgi:hypothetical protein
MFSTIAWLIFSHAMVENMNGGGLTQSYATPRIRAHPGVFLCNSTQIRAFQIICIANPIKYAHGPEMS